MADMLPRKNLMLTMVSEDPTAFGMRLAEAGREGPAFFDEGLGMPVLLRSADIQTVLRDEATFSTRVFQNGLMKDSLIATAGDAHTRMRKLYNDFFPPQKIARYEHDIVAPAVELALDDLARTDQPDLIDHFCTQVPQRVVSALFGLPAEKIAENDVLVRAILKSIVRPYDPVAIEEGNQAYAAMSEDLHEIARRELAQPGPTLFGEIARALIANGDGNVEACERVVLTLVTGSYETTIWGIASTVAALLHYPEAAARIRANPELVPNAIEESWRWCGSAVGTVRFVEREATIAGETFAPGTVLQLSWLGTHYDPAVYENPEVFEPERKTKTMIFSGGPHFCVGAPLARMVPRVAITGLLARFPGLRADNDRPAPKYMFGTRGSIVFGPDNLPACLN
jgi:cytochrome P450